MEQQGQKDAYNLQAVVSIDPDGHVGVVLAITTYEIYMEQYVRHLGAFKGLCEVPQMFMHSLWISDWRLLVMGVSEATDILLLSSAVAKGWINAWR